MSTSLAKNQLTPIEKKRKKVLSSEDKYTAINLKIIKAKYRPANRLDFPDYMSKSEQ